MRLRTGFGLVDGDEAPDREVVTATLLYFMELAARCAAAYTRAKGRSVVREVDILRGLKLQALPSTGFLGREDLRRNVVEYVARLRGAPDDDGGGDAPETLPGDDRLVARMEGAEAAFEAWDPPPNSLGWHVRAAIRSAERHHGRGERVGGE